MPELPDATRFWRQQRPLMLLMLAASISTLLLFMMMDMGTGVFVMAEIGGLLGVTVPCVYLFGSGSVDMAMQAKLTYSLALAAFLLDLFTISMVDGILLAIATDCNPEDPDLGTLCKMLWVYIAFFTLVLGGHAWLCYVVSRKGQITQQMLNPVTSGMLQV